MWYSKEPSVIKTSQKPFPYTFGAPYSPPAWHTYTSRLHAAQSHRCCRMLSAMAPCVPLPSSGLGRRRPRLRMLRPLLWFVLLRRRTLADAATSRLSGRSILPYYLLSKPFCPCALALSFWSPKAFELLSFVQL